MRGIEGRGDGPGGDPEGFADALREFDQCAHGVVVVVYPEQVWYGHVTPADVDEIVGLSPAISIDQKSHSSNPRSTVATITEIYDYLRVLCARVGQGHCPKCDAPITAQSRVEGAY